LGVWLKLAVCFGLSLAAVGARDTQALTILSAVDVLLLLVCRVGVRGMLTGVKALALQFVIITALYLLRFGAEGVTSGLSVSWQLYLAFLPGVVFVQTTPGHRINAALGKVLPHRTAFVLTASLCAIPGLVRDITAIYHTQALRGARILPRDIVRPSSWPDFVHCLLVPTVVKVMALAGETALAAKARDFGAMDDRTNWPGR
jgi:energy-coupling factor transporter transmembrane protein EcfT